MVLSCGTNFTGTLYCHKVTTDFLLAREHFIPPPSTTKDVRLRRPFAVAPHVHTSALIAPSPPTIVNICTSSSDMPAAALSLCRYVQRGEVILNVKAPHRCARIWAGPAGPRPAARAAFAQAVLPWHMHRRIVKLVFPAPCCFRLLRGSRTVE